ncbi:MAG: DivIVA domain-containing protein [Acidimicrobiia bacterium]|nr:DivIVA domain-containing protein [Acidimicrobiia bacterium]
MPLNPIDITQQTFRVSLRGYDEGEVDAFLDEVVSSMKEYDQRLRDADERVSVLEEQLQANRETEVAMRRAFVAAQRTADEIVAEARVEGERLVSEASAQAVEISADQVRERDALRIELADLRSSVSDMKARMRAFAKGVLPDLESLDTDLASMQEPSPSRPSLSERVAELSSAEEVAAHIPPFASAGGEASSDSGFEVFEASEPEDLESDVPDPEVFEELEEPAPIDVDEVRTESTPTEELPTFGSHRADAEPSTFAPSSGGWLTSPNEPLPGRGMAASNSDFATGEIPAAITDDDADWSLDESDLDTPAEWTAEEPVDDAHEPTPEPRRRPWERES